MNLKTLRTQMNFTQKQLADKMDTTQQTIARWENGKTPLNAAQIKHLCSILQCTAQDLLGWEVEDDEEAFDGGMLLDHGTPYGTLRLRMGFGVREYPIGDVARDAVEGYMDRNGSLNHKAGRLETLVFATLTRRLLLVNASALRSVSLISDEVEAMPAYEAADEEGVEEFDFDDGDLGDDLEDAIPIQEAICVTFKDGSVELFPFSQGVADEVYALLAGTELQAGRFLMVEDEEAGARRTFIELNEVAMLDLPAELFATMTSDDDVAMLDQPAEFFATTTID
ncbi:MAG: helix-turn-helix transcriptional regulator [Rhodobacteraceae bacterium]|nr:helix-turn-helix transcriptional regulator [Paracoccaceae bacterium]